MADLGDGKVLDKNPWNNFELLLRRCKIIIDAFLSA